MREQVPYEGMDKQAIWTHVCLRGGRPTPADDPSWDRSLVSIMTRCWSSDPDRRPTSSELLEMLSHPTTVPSISPDLRGSWHQVGFHSSASSLPCSS